MLLYAEYIGLVVRLPPRYTPCVWYRSRNHLCQKAVLQSQESSLQHL